MNLSLRISRSIVILLSGIAAVSLNNNIEGYSAMFGVTLVIAALISVLFFFVYFNKPINPKVLMELFLDGFAGIIIFTFNNSNDDFFLTVFSFWTFVYGMFYLTTGLFDKTRKEYLPLYTSVGIIMMIFGFMPLHFNEESHSLIIYAVGASMIIYSLSNIYIFIKRKSDIY